MAGSATSDATGLDEGFVDNIPDYPVQQDAECSVSVHFRIRVVNLGALLLYLGRQGLICARDEQRFDLADLPYFADQ